MHWYLSLGSRRCSLVWSRKRNWRILPQQPTSMNYTIHKYSLLLEVLFPHLPILKSRPTTSTYTYTTCLTKNNTYPLLILRHGLYWIYSSGQRYHRLRNHSLSSDRDRRCQGSDSFGRSNSSRHQNHIGRGEAAFFTVVLAMVTLLIEFAKLEEGGHTRSLCSHDTTSNTSNSASAAQAEVSTRY
jgi:hypothetical protein